MTSTLLAEQEIRRFLASQEPEVLCITGDWGVGKTYIWQKHLDQVRTLSKAGLQRYSYVSLFGLNSIEGIKQAIFENMEFLVPEGQSGFEWLVSLGNKGLQQGKKVAASAATLIPKVGDAVSKMAQPYLFASIYSQIICIDDLERSGKDLRVKDVLGLISFLREQRKCKIVLLLNEGKLSSESDSDQRDAKSSTGAASPAKEFEESFEKVIDTKVVFAPTAEEAAAIVFPKRNDEAVLIAQCCSRLSLRNIRVLKRIERLVKLLEPAIKDASDGTKESAVSSVVLFSWSKFDIGSNPPPLSFFRDGKMNFVFAASEADETTKRWRRIGREYGFVQMSELDHALMNFVETSVLDLDSIKDAAARHDIKNQANELSSMFETAFGALFRSFKDNEEGLSKNLVGAVRAGAGTLNLDQLDKAAKALTALGRASEVNDLVALMDRTRGKEFWAPPHVPMEEMMKSSSYSEPVKRVVKRYLADETESFDFARDFAKAARDLEGRLLGKLTERSVDEFVALFDSVSGEELDDKISAGLHWSTISNAPAEAIQLVDLTVTALQQIAKRSKLNALQVARFIS